MRRAIRFFSLYGVMLAIAAVAWATTSARAVESTAGGIAPPPVNLSLQPAAAGNLSQNTAATNSSVAAATDPSTMRLDVVPPADAPDEDAWNDYPDRWWLKTTPQVWFMGAGGHVGLKGSSFSKNVSVDASFSDITKHLDGGIGLSLETGKGPFFAGFQGLYAQFKNDGITGPAGFSSIDLNAKFALLNGYFGYHFLDLPLSSGNPFPSLSLDGLIGTEWTYIEVKISPARFNSVSKNTSWFDPFVGLRGKLYLTQQIDIQALGEIGGFDADQDKLFWNVNAMVEYRFNPKWSIFAGYQAVSQNYEGDHFDWKMILSGPVVGLAARW